MEEIKKHNSLGVGGGYINASLKELRINEEKGPSVNVFDRLRATGGSKASPFKKKKKKTGTDSF